jgi:hypothetical protein
VSAHVVLKGEHELFWTEYLEHDALLEVSQCLLPVAWQLFILRGGASRPFFPRLLICLHVSYDAIKGRDLADSGVENVVVKLGHKGWKRINWLGVFLLL